MVKFTTIYCMFRQVYNVVNPTDCFPAKQSLVATAYEMPAKLDSLLHAFSLSVYASLAHTL